MFERINPVTGAVASRSAAMTPEQASQVADHAARAFPEWSETGPGERREILTQAASRLRANADQLVESMIAEVGATEGWARFNVDLGARILIEAAAATTHVAGDVIPSDRPGCIAMAVRAPIGVILGIAPWNAPVILGVRAIAMALACGNTAILKASEACPETHRIVVESIVSGGMPEGVLNLVTNDPANAAEVVGALIDHPEVRRINFTGSTGVGRVIAERAARQLKPVLLELGGKAPLVVLDDADIEEAVAAAAFGAYMNQGQICMSTERIIVTPGAAHEFVARLAEKTEKLRASDPNCRLTPLGAVVGAHAVDKVRKLIDDAVKRGAILLASGEAEGAIIQPALIDRVVPGMRLYSEESFGPVTAIIHARDEDDALRLANDTDYGLSAAIFTRDIAKGLRLARKIRSGICHINGPTVFDEPQMPFGGVGWSGYGRFGGKAGIDAFTELRWITIQTQPGHYPI